MKRQITIATFAAVAAGAALSADTIRSRFDETRDSSSVRKVLIENVHGNIDVRSGGTEIRIEAEIEAESGRYTTAAEALDAWPLIVERQGSILKVIVDHPGRCEDGSGKCWHSWDEDDQGRVVYDFTITVPDRIDLEARTVIGVVETKGTFGRLELANVNGSIAAEVRADGGAMTTVNGGIDASFLSLPTDSWRFKSINGEVDLYYPSDLDATVSISTMNGEIYTNYDWSVASTARPERARREGTRWVIRDAGRTGVRIGSGDIPIEIDTINGNIYIRKD